jgi:hypothetical protein
MWLFIVKALPWVTRVAPFLGLIKTKAKIITSVLSVVAMVATYLWIGHLNNTIDRLEADATVFELVNQDNLATINSLEGANKSLADAIRITDEVRDAAEEKARQRAAQAASQLNNTLTELEDLRNANPTCDQLANMDLGSACPLVTDRMRDAADDS